MERESTPPPYPETDQEREFLAASRAVDEADPVLIWSALLAELGYQAAPLEEDGHPRP